MLLAAVWRVQHPGLTLDMRKTFDPSEHPQLVSDHGQAHQHAHDYALGLVHVHCLTTDHKDGGFAPAFALISEAQFASGLHHGTCH